MKRKIIKKIWICKSQKRLFLFVTDYNSKQFWFHSIGEARRWILTTNKFIDTHTITKIVMRHIGLNGLFSFRSTQIFDGQNDVIQKKAKIFF